MSNNKKYNVSEEFMKIYIEKSQAIPSKPNKKSIQKEIVNRHRFKTQTCNSANYMTIIEAENTINRKAAVKELNKYLNDLFLAYEMEKGLFEYSLIHITTNVQQKHLVSNVYQHHLNTLCRNLDVNDTGVENKTLLPMIKEFGLNPFFVAFLTPDQMHPDRWKEIKDKKKHEEETENNLATTDMYTCKKCKDKKFKITEMQLRSADEPSSKFLTCMTCHYTFII